jgi:hypothetical protein
MNRKVVIGVAGLAVLAGGAAYAITDHLTSPDVREATVVAAPTPAAASPTGGESVREQIEAARAKAAKDGFPLQRGLTAAADSVTGPVKERTERVGKGSVRVVSAGYDLTGQRELLWAADDGRKVGDADCTQTFRFSNNMTPRERPNMLLCWRTSAERSVVTVAVQPEGRPSSEGTVKILEREWAKLG